MYEDSQHMHIFPIMFMLAGQWMSTCLYSQRCVNLWLSKIPSPLPLLITMICLCKLSWPYTVAMRHGRRSHIPHNPRDCPTHVEREFMFLRLSHGCLHKSPPCCMKTFLWRPSILMFLLHENIPQFYISNKVSLSFCLLSVLIFPNLSARTLK